MTVRTICRLAVLVFLGVSLAMMSGCDKGEAQGPARAGDKPVPTATPDAAGSLSEVTVPYLRATIRFISRREGGELIYDVHIEPVGKMPRVKVLPFTVGCAMAEVALRKQTGEPVRVMGGTVATVQPGLRFKAVPDGGLDLRLMPSGHPKSILYWPALGPDYADLPAGTRLRYYLSSEVTCARETDDEHWRADGEYFHVPLLGEGFVLFEP